MQRKQAFLSDENIFQSTSDSKISISHNNCEIFSQSFATVESNSGLKRKMVGSNEVVDFVRASDIFQNSKNKTQSKNMPLHEKIVSKTESTFLAKPVRIIFKSHEYILHRF